MICYNNYERRYLKLLQTVTIKVKLQVPKQVPEFVYLTTQFRDACNYVSKWIFEHDFNLNQIKINQAIYYNIRNKFHLKAQLTQSVIRAVVARYKTVKTQLNSKPYRVYDKASNKYYFVPRDLSWLQQPLVFKRPQADLQRSRDWSIVKNQLSIITLNGRIKCDYVCHGFDQYLDSSWKFGLAKLVKQHSKWFLHVSASKEFPDYDKDQTQHVIGVDRGLRFLTTCYDNHGETLFQNGKDILKIRRKYKKLRQELQAKGTKSAKRRLKQIGQKENRWMTDVNHQLSKTLIDHYGSNSLFVLEDLTNVTFNTTKQRRRENRYEHNSWAFYQLEQFLIYKAHLHHSDVIKVDAHYTSQRCPKCGRINKDNRNHQLHLYCCDRCGYKTNDDRVAAMNIQVLGTQYISGQEQPKFFK